VRIDRLVQRRVLTVAVYVRLSGGAIAREHRFAGSDGAPALDDAASDIEVAKQVQALTNQRGPHRYKLLDLYEAVRSDAKIRCDAPHSANF
jgi:hypothetical protein